MKLIGLLDSPFVRRVAISAKPLDLPFEHESISVFRHVEQFRTVNPVAKAPTLVTDGGAGRSHPAVGRRAALSGKPLPIVLGG